MLIVGLTGGIASGKSTVCRMLECLGACVVDTDLISRQVVERGTEGWREVVETFGREILLEDGSLDRKRLGDLVFGAPEKRKVLEAILHPKIFAEKERKIAAIRAKDPFAVVIVDIPLLIELGRQDSVDKVVVVYVSPQVQLERLAARDGSGIVDAGNRIAAQMPIDAKVAHADYVINNEGTVRETRKAVAELLEKLRQDERAARN